MEELEFARLMSELTLLERDLRDRQEYLAGWRKWEGQAIDASGSPYGAPVRGMDDSEDPWQTEIQAKIDALKKRMRELE
jgi:hypothetical protein